MADKVINVVIWKARAVPGQRTIPPHLKMAILSRGRIRIPSDRADFFIKESIASGETWPNRLTKPFEQIFPDIAITIELFQQRKPNMSHEEVRDALHSYLVVRRQKHLSECYKLIYSLKRHSERRTLEKSLQLDLSRLYSKPKVYPGKREGKKYYLVVYACIPKLLKNYIRPIPIPKPVPPPSTTGLVPLPGILAESGFWNVRSSPTDINNQNLLGTLTGHLATVVVTEKKRTPMRVEGNPTGGNKIIDPIEWLKFTTITPLPINNTIGKKVSLPAGTDAWVTSSAFLTVTAPLDLLLGEVREYEKRSTAKLSKRITHLRQRTHKKSMDFDDVIKSGSGIVYLENRKYNEGKWQYVIDYATVSPYDRQHVDFHHLMLGLDVLGRPEEKRKTKTYNIGTNWSASTWAGDMGSASAEMTLKLDKKWEKKNNNATLNDRAQHYFYSRAPHWDLLADIDGWELVKRDPKIYSTIVKILDGYYGENHGLPMGPHPIGRAKAIARFLKHYGFEFDFDLSKNGNQFPMLIKQKYPINRIAKELLLFSEIWILKRAGDDGIISGLKKATKGKFKIHTNNDALTRQLLNFIYWLEYLAIENEVRVSK